MSDKVKIIEIEGRKFQIHKFDAKTSLKVSKVIIAKILPFVETFLPALTNSGGEANVKDLAESLGNADNLGEMLSSISLEKMAHALDIIDDNDLDRIIDFSLKNCYELLSAGPVQVLSPNGMYGVQGVEDDMLLMLTISSLWAITLSVMPQLTSPIYSVTSITAGLNFIEQSSEDIRILFNEVTSGREENIEIRFV